VSPSGISSVSNAVTVVKDLAIDGIWLHEAWPQCWMPESQYPRDRLCVECL
jgi:hypothetical protein